MPAREASSTMYCIVGLSNIGNISLGIAFVAGKNLVPKPAAGIIAFNLSQYVNPFIYIVYRIHFKVYHYLKCFHSRVNPFTNLLSEGTVVHIDNHSVIFN